jgi:lipoprotein Spr
MKIFVPNWLPVIFIFFSCKSLQSIQSRDQSTEKKPTARIERLGRDPVFMDDITITPGETPVNNKKLPIYSNTQVASPDTHSVQSTHSQAIEKAKWLQFKYAIRLNTAVEKLTNLTLLEAIESWYGTRYCLGGTTERCIDCSAFSQTILQEVYSIKLPRIAQDQYNQSIRISVNDLKEGDLVFFHTTTRLVSHVGVYLTNNKFVHASTSQGVMISDLNEPYWAGRYIGAGRVNRPMEYEHLDVKK